MAPGSGQASTVSLGALAEASRAGRTVPVEQNVQHGGGPLFLRLEVHGAARVWLSDLVVAR